ncbi:MAG: CbiX/SirB N-terminal domain-containing protein [Gemmataceae bacterium]|nr:CbiX/SirB N-terminal domain-containing protein [Gemmataceae bacterium]
MATALLLIAHGSRNPEANADLVQLADEVRRRGGFDVVETAYLELAEPTIGRAGERCAAQGARRVVLLPYFLSAGVHVRDDLGRHRDELAARYPEITFVLAEPLGPHPLLLDIVMQRAAAV